MHLPRVVHDLKLSRFHISASFPTFADNLILSPGQFVDHLLFALKYDVLRIEMDPLLTKDNVKWGTEI